MTYRSESRGIMYTAPPSGDDDAQNDETAEAEASDAEPETTELDATTDANWTGTVPADD
ncbi:hypothetical protein [Halorussus salinus]|uniref:hypothetical protein n=1 Tax=Halorussus salinus TaxID=1364935 RepID=UPI00138F5E3B|nr:hypothetical protein [Halorussus salinus]